MTQPYSEDAIRALKTAYDRELENNIAADQGLLTPSSVEEAIEQEKDLSRSAGHMSGLEEACRILTGQSIHELMNPKE